MNWMYFTEANVLALFAGLIIGTVTFWEQSYKNQVRFPWRTVILFSVIFGICVYEWYPS